MPGSADVPRRLRARTALTLLSAVLWLQPPLVLPQPSRSGPDGPPRPFGVQPAPGPVPAHTPRSLVRAQDRALLYGPFPHSGLARGTSDGGLMLSEDPAVRALAMGDSRAAGADLVRIPVNWRDIVQAAPPAGFQATDPAGTAYDFTRIDAAVRSAAAAGLEPLLVVSHAPAFAEAPHRWTYAYPGSWAPSPAALRDFAAALARRYSGAFPDPLLGGRALPRVRLFQAWNEPNLARYLEPQWVARGRSWSAFSPLLYRQLLDGFYDGVKSVAPADTVIAAGIAPEGEREGVGAMAPISFLRGMLCLQGSTHSERGGHRGGRGKRRGRSTPGPQLCAEPPRFDVLAFHPLSVFDPDVPAASALDASISDIAKVTALLRLAERRRTVLPARPKPLWVTELNWQSAPQSPHGVPRSLQAAWVSRALHRLWVAGASLVTWEFLIDPYPSLSLSAPTGPALELLRPAGLYSAGVLDGHSDPALAQPKPFLTGFAFPFDPLRVDRQHVRVWALLAGTGRLAQLQRRTHSGTWRTIAQLRAGAGGVLNALVSLRGPADLRLSSGALVSAPGRVPRAHGSSHAPPKP
ncbi:MAG TPA: hypothetical protein VID70_00875 [Solirubrobacteraceae bacterium]|jgi:hypothetical protein